MSRAAVPAYARLVRNPRVVIGAVIVTLLVVAAVFAPWLSPVDPLAQDLMSPLLPPGSLAEPMMAGDPSVMHWLGTDSLGRDVVSRMIWGARTALIVALLAATLSAIVGTVLGGVAGYFGGRLDTVICRMVDVWMAFPPVLLAVVLVAMLGTGLTSVVIAIVVVDWTRFARIVRAEVRAQRQLDYVTSAQMLGLGPVRTLFSEILPNVAPLLITLISLEMGVAIVVEAILSFVGLSIASGEATWGSMIGEGRLYVNQSPWLMTVPIIATIVSVIGLNALGDGLRHELDPVVRK